MSLPGEHRIIEVTPDSKPTEPDRIIHVEPLPKRTPAPKEPAKTPQREPEKVPA